MYVATYLSELILIYVSTFSSIRYVYCTVEIHQIKNSWVLCLENTFISVC